MRKISGTLRPSLIRTTAMIAPATMKSAFRMLLAAMTRERWLGSLRAWIRV